MTAQAPAWARPSKPGIMGSMADNLDDIPGVTDRAQLAEADRALRLRRMEKLMAEGVMIEDPYNTYIDDGVEIGPETIIRPGTFLEGETRIGSDCVIGPMTSIIDSVVGDRSQVIFSKVTQSQIGDDCSVGPNSHLRPGTRLENSVKVGAFAEIKNSTIGEGSKIPHLAYVGDADVGKDVNLGAGTITGNYDAETREKARTVIKDGGFTGSNTVLRAPVTVGEGAGTGAGAVVTEDVPDREVWVGIPAKPLRKRKTPRSENE
jgi:bifunctional UDP-N-acetylglucosamine pyrophosphorylase/glucosamine-1-phosphate N-acetyltransferase